MTTLKKSISISTCRGDRKAVGFDNTSSQWSRAAQTKFVSRGWR